MSDAFSPPLSLGEPAPWFTAPMLGQATGADFDKAGGRHVLLLFFGSAANPAADAALRLVEANADLLKDRRAVVLGVTIDPHDLVSGRIAALQRSGMQIFIDADRRVSALYGAIQPDAQRVTFNPYWLLLDPTLRVTGLFSLRFGTDAMAALRRQLDAPAIEISAPVLILPNVLDLQFAAELVDLHKRHGGQETGVMRQVGDRTVEVHHHDIKRRRDHMIQAAAVQARLRESVMSRLVPMIERCFQYRPTEIERYIVSCYDTEDSAHFAPHRDNTTRATAHRRIAVTINLTDDYDGGELRFPEFGARRYRAPLGGAIAFSCSLLHEVTRMTAGRRYATLPFLYGSAPRCD
ncbi:redoxin domain-containing protein [Sphingomonas populi]|uniref:Redoxin domain-containing protein n=1 Tax=Sphingomonas populi TaxID=2484750 RepID=A0A4Q6XU59_9SPHN|nr:2OG-Fe(II) oxygenase [Sphingomonas populi]RZF63435.1 redoxin domain-containing protein [Sphingomonas populi]